VHKKFETMNGEAAVTMLRQLLKLPHNPHPWDELWQEAAVKHPTRDAWWEERNLMPMLKEIDIPVYLGCDWQNVPLHLPSTFATWKGLSDNACVRMGMLGKFGLTWPWESMHTEALAWYDHWLKGHDTGITDGPPIRYFLPGADQRRTSDSWPPKALHRELALRADGGLDADEGEAGGREFMVLGSGLGRITASEIDPPSLLAWTGAPLSQDIDVVGEIELRLVASATAMDTAWIATLQDVAPGGETTEVTAGWLRASLREVDDAASRPGAPVLPCRNPQAVPPGEKVEYRIPLVPNARRFRAGHRIRLTLTSDDHDPSVPAIMNFLPASAPPRSLNTVRSSSRLLIPVLT
jgi:predicted acyl esterase